MPISRYTEAEYLRMEEASPDKHEFRNGEIIDMAGGTRIEFPLSEYGGVVFSGSK